jgi:hypothetical protein
MCSPLHIRAPTRPLILQCVTELYRRFLVASALPPPPVVVVSNSVGIKCSASATDDRADDCTFLTTNRSTYCRTRTGANRRRQLIAMPIPKRSVVPTTTAVTATAVTATAVLIISITPIRNSLFIASAVAPTSIPRLRAGGDGRNHERQQANNCQQPLFLHSHSLRAQLFGKVCANSAIGVFLQFSRTSYKNLYFDVYDTVRNL